jgi:hypothetical protein
MPPSITTRSYNNARTGATDHETELSVTAVRTRGIVKLFSMPILDDPRLDAQPLAVGGVRMASGQVHDVIFQASMGNTIYAFDAATGAELWKRNLGRPITGSTDIDIHSTNVKWGILSTPVIDEGAGILYACAWISQDGTWQEGQHFLAALRLADGSLVHPQLLSLEGAVYAHPGLPEQKFVSAQRKQRAALTLLQGRVLIPFGTVKETDATARGWLIAVDVAGWRIAATWCSTVTGSGGGVWHSGGGPAVADDGSIFVITGNGAFNPAKGDFGESIVKLRLPADNSGRLTVVSWWTPFTDPGRTGHQAAAADRALPSNLQVSRVLGHALRLGIAVPKLRGVTPRHVVAQPHEDDVAIAPTVRRLLAAMDEADWRLDQDFGSGGPVFAQVAGAILACGKDGILYTGKAAGLGNTQPGDLTPAHAAANYAKLLMPPILYTYFDPGVPPAPVNETDLNHEFPGDGTRHLHGTPLLWHSNTHGLMHFVGGENSALRAWTLGANGTSAYQAGSNEVASVQAGHPPGGMPGWGIALAANQGADGIIVAMVPYKDSNMAASPGRFLVYDAQNFARNPDGSNRLQVIWDSENVGPEHAFTHPKFNRPIIWNGRIYRPTYDGRIDVYGLTGA